ncbi:uncharacterized protein F5147DRAFT_725469 [Suillus discolor]|uniref:DUF6534 domain-containing protein n=1 Tax=Suillus discolor TaxID=1912936 RepID=A0A9P7EUU5_9AGAM|nr:uncharacterized protein F5147DRAFT_725469 [Suillus discolor]KAG2089860.1 hypothetical protein F5147DRAFT_725469 [Suillus discolor]
MNSFKRASDFNAELVIGPIQVCGMLSAALFGCLGCQSYLYFVRFRDDHLALKATVSAVILIQLGHFVCIISMLWTMTVSTYGDPSQLAVLPIATDVAIPLSGFTVVIVQSFYAFRLWKLSRNVFLLILCQILSVIAQTSTCVLAARAISMTNIADFQHNQLLLIELTFIARATCDLITTAGIAWGLKKRRYPEIEDTVTIIDQLFKWTIETGLVTSLVALTLATLLPALKQPNYSGIGLWLLWPNVVGNTLLASLNRRSLLRDRFSTSDTQSCSCTSSTIVFNTGATQSQADPPEKEFQGPIFTSTNETIYMC